MKAMIAVVTAIDNCFRLLLAALVLISTGVAVAQTDRPSTTPTYTAWGSQSYEIEEGFTTPRSPTAKKSAKRPSCATTRRHGSGRQRLRTGSPKKFADSSFGRKPSLAILLLPGRTRCARNRILKKQPEDTSGLPQRWNVSIRAMRSWGAFRQQVWPAQLVQLQAETAYYDAQAWFVQNQNALLQMYIQAMFSTFADQLGEHLQYILRRHAVSFWKDLADCATKTLTLALGERLLKRIPGIDPEGYLGWSRVPGVAAPHGELTSELMPDLVTRQETREMSNRQSTIFSCLADTTRASLTRAAANSMRYSFVKGTARDYDVPEEIAEYWWVRLINPEDVDAGAWEPRTVALPTNMSGDTWIDRCRSRERLSWRQEKHTYVRYKDSQMMLEIARTPRRHASNRRFGSACTRMPPNTPSTGSRRKSRIRKADRSSGYAVRPLINC